MHPSVVALHGVLSACCHTGRVYNRLRRLDNMERCPWRDARGRAQWLHRRHARPRREAGRGRGARRSDTHGARYARTGLLLVACQVRGNVQRVERVIRWMDDGGDDCGDHGLNMDIPVSHHVLGSALCWIWLLPARTPSRRHADGDDR